MAEDVQALHPEDDPPNEISRRVLLILQQARATERHLNRFSDWLNNPDDMEGVYSRIATIGLGFMSAVAFSLFLCTLTLAINETVVYINCNNVGLGGCSWFGLF